MPRLFFFFKEGNQSVTTTKSDGKNQSQRFLMWFVIGPFFQKKV